jgi:signal transduction histidine kinase
MRKKKDPRINAGNTFIREYLFIYLALSAFNGFHMWLYQEFQTHGLLETNIQLAINILMGYVAFSAACVTGLVAVIRHISWSRPMRKVSEAARKITHGDFSARIAPLRKDGRKDYVEVMFDDFNTMARELQSIETLKTDFIANVSHEIKTPLAVIQNYAAALQNDYLHTDERRDYCKTIVEASQKLSTLVSNILKLNKLENQGIMPEARAFNLDEQIRRCAVGFEELWESKNINFNAELEEITVCYDENMLEIVWNNLISNAIKFTGPCGTISIKLQARGGCVYASISDTGCGMDEDTQKRVFDKFFQGDTSRAQEGNGLGLALVKQIVTLLDGTVTVESRPEQGSTFTVCLIDRYDLIIP